MVLVEILCVVKIITGTAIKRCVFVAFEEQPYICEFTNAAEDNIKVSVTEDRLLERIDPRPCAMRMVTARQNCIE